MKSNLIYRASFYIMLTVATMILCGEATDSRLNWFLPLTTAAAGIVAFLTVDQNRRWGLPRDVANFLALGTLGILYIEYSADPTQIIACLGHWVIYLQLIKYFLPKTAEDDWFLFLLGLTEVLIGSVTNQGDMVGAWLLFWAMLAVWVLGLFFLQREARRFQSEAVPLPFPPGRRRRIPITVCSMCPTSQPASACCRSPCCWEGSSSCFFPGSRAQPARGRQTR